MESNGHKKEPMSLRDRIALYLAQIPGAVSGQGGHDQTFSVACALVNGFALDEADALYWLGEYSVKCQPPWSDAELAHKIKSAIQAVHKKVRGHLLNSNGKYSGEDFRYKSFTANPKPEKPLEPTLDPSTEIEKFLKGFRASEADLVDASQIRPSDDWTQDGALLVSHLYHAGERINFVTGFKLTDQKNGLTKPVPSGFGETVDRDLLASTWQLVGMPQSEAGGWMRMNPMDGVGIGDKNVTSFRFILLEFDSIPLDLQMSLLAKLPLPIAAILTSGGRSVHAWCKADCADAEEYKSTALRLLKLLTRFGLDAKNKNPSRLSRLVGVTRTLGAADDGRQRLLYLNPEPTGKAIL